MASCRHDSWKVQEWKEGAGQAGRGVHVVLSYRPFCRKYHAVTVALPMRDPFVSDKAQLLEVRRQLEAASRPPLPASSRPGAALPVEGTEGGRDTAPSSCPRDVQVDRGDTF